MHKQLFILITFIAAGSFAQNGKQVYEDKSIKVEYHLKNGLWDGKYVSHYANGQKKAEGHFKDNLRIGKWDIWDSTGKVHTEFTIKPDSLPRNKSGYFEYPFLREKDVFVEKRIWRDITKENNKLLFANEELFDTLYHFIISDSIKVFKDEEFESPRSISDIKFNFPAGKYEIIAYKIKEDWFFDGTRNKSDVRPLGLYLILRPKGAEDDETRGLGWIYFPQARAVFATQPVWDKHQKHITSIDDLFWYRHFYGQIYKETNVYNRSIAAYAKTKEQALREAERIEIDMIELEHLARLYGKSAFTFELPKQK